MISGGPSRHSERGPDISGFRLARAREPRIGLASLLLAALLAAVVAPQTAASPLLSPSTDFSVGVSPSGVTSADFNKDGNPDLATADLGFSRDGLPGSVSVLLGTGTGSAAAASGLGPSSPSTTKRVASR